MRRSIADEIRASARLRAIADVVAARESDAPQVFVVGGTVRDILLGEEGDDLDLAVEGDAIGFAYQLAQSLGGHATPHRKFGTAVVSDGGPQHIDVVTTRRESYESPGALPTVEHAELTHDLHRRDFTINAMAASLEPSNLGELFDPYGGRADLDARTVRVLHDGSFEDDPTRILRGITYEARYGFRFDERTEALARACIASGHVGELASSRMRDELIDLLEDTHAADGIRRLGDLGVDRAIHPHLRGGDEAAALFGRAVALRDELGLDAPSWRVGLEVLAREVTADDGLELLDRLKVRRRDADQVIGAIAFAPGIVRRLRSERLDSSQIVALADPHAPDAPLLALAIDERAELRDYFTRLRAVRLEIRGSDIVAMGLEESPRVGDILAIVRERKLNGELVGGREAELALARRLVGEPTA